MQGWHLRLNQKDIPQYLKHLKLPEKIQSQKNLPNTVSGLEINIIGSDTNSVSTVKLMQILCHISYIHF